jgi:hypothetical protein
MYTGEILVPFHSKIGSKGWELDGGNRWVDKEDNDLCSTSFSRDTLVYVPI